MLLFFYKNLFNITMTIKKKKILFAAYGGGHIKVLLPVVQQLLQKNHGFEPQILAFTTAVNDCKAQNIPCKTMLNFAHLYPPEAMEIGRKLASELPYNAVNSDESASYLGISFFELAENIGYEAAYKEYKEKGRASFYPVKSMEKLLAEIKPDLVVTTNSPRSEMALLKAASNLGIPSLCVVDFYISKLATWLSNDWCGTKICVLDEFVKQQLIDIGRDPSQIIITGNPAFDHYGVLEAQKIVKKYREKNISGYSKLIAYASNVEPKSDEPIQLQNRVLDFLVQECARLGYRLSHRQHPSEAVTKRPENILNGNEVSLETFISSADLMITFPSTVIYEARLLGVPTLALGMSKLMEQSEYIMAGNYKTAYNFEEISNFLEKLETNAEKQLFTSEKACKKVIVVLKEIFE